ncbi:hypothetical protein [Devosia sp. CN2-171]|uniref:hypothetical protein n=1 Tax=Devosia sp. CN2-171 TaxID=3400909 RepID=UPI003BF86F7C
MQTFIVHNSHPRELLRDLGWKGFASFQVYVGSMILSGPLHTLFVASVIATTLLQGLIFDVWFALTCLITLIGYGGPAALVVAGLRRLGRSDLIAIQLLLPVYWVLHSIAGMRALHELLTRPYFWAKTLHGETRMARLGLARRTRAVSSSIGKD